MNKCLFFCLVMICGWVHASHAQQTRKTPAPLYRDPIYDGAADPVVIWNKKEKNWWMLYTQRRANVDGADVAYCYGTAIGVASTNDHGQTWIYRGQLPLEFEKGKNTFWAPDVVYHDGKYHMFVAYIQGVRNHWGGTARLIHYTSTDLWDWTKGDDLKLTSDKIIDPSLVKDANGKWKMFYKDEASKTGNMLMAESANLVDWTLSKQPVIEGRGQEGPKVFFYQDWYWLLTDEWAGMRVYRSKDMMTWLKQGLILDKPGNRPDDGPSGAHGDVVVVNDKAYIFYFTHPGRKKHTESPLNADGVLPYALRRSSIQAAGLEVLNGTLVTKVGADFSLYLPDLPPVPAKGREENHARSTTRNDIYFADPTITYADKRYYLYGTDGLGADSGFRAYQSADLVNWKPLTTVSGNKRILTRGNVFGTKGFWAPQVFNYQKQYYIAYTANENIAIAQSKHLLEAFLQDNIKALDAPVKQIDPYIFRDDDGKLYLYHVRLQQGNVIFVAELNHDLKSIKESTLRECISAAKYPQPWENTQQVEWTVAEGPTVIKRGARYYMFYSANDFRNPHYAVGYAVADNPFGPWIKYEGNPIISRKVTGANGSGHGDLLVSPDGQPAYVFHTHFSDQKVAPRKTAIIKIKFVKNTGGESVEVDESSFRFLQASEH